MISRMRIFPASDEKEGEVMVKRMILVILTVVLLSANTACGMTKTSNTDNQVPKTSVETTSGDNSKMEAGNGAKADKKDTEWVFTNLTEDSPAKMSGSEDKQQKLFCLWTHICSVITEA